MDKNAIKRYAVWARRELIDRVSKRAAVFGVTADGFGDPNADSVNGHLLSGAERRQRQALIRRIEEKGYEQVMEEVAYTWFNRFAALRFMEVNGYLPSHVRVFTNDVGEFKPQILSEAIHLDLIGLNMEKVYRLKDANLEEELFKYLLIVQCNALNGILPGMFQKIDDYTELLLPDYLLREGSAIEQMVSLIPEDDWKDQVQIIGWLYQYYNTEPKDKVFADLKKNIKISKQNIPAATQLFTPDWIVHYMVENSLGRLWVEGHPSARKYLPDHNGDGSVRVEEGKWNYYLEEAEQEPEVQAQLDEIRKLYAALKPEEILTIDPCAGSGHILCVLFDVLVSIYEDYGYTAREAAVSIVQNNLWGLDIDDRAAQLAYFAVMMKARQYDRRFFTREVQPHVYAIQESNGINRNHLNYLGRGLSDLERNNAVNQMNSLLDEFVDAKEYGSILQPEEYDWGLLTRFVEDATLGQQMSFEEAGLDVTQDHFKSMIAQGQVLAQKYHAVVTNPPYMGSNGMSLKLSQFVKENYPITKMDMFSVFVERVNQMSKSNGFSAMIIQPSFISLGSFEKLRVMLLRSTTIQTLIHMGRGIFGIDFGSVAFVMRKTYIHGYLGGYSKPHAKTFQFISPDDIALIFLESKGNPNYTFDFSKYNTSDDVEDGADEGGLQRVFYWSKQDNFFRIPNTPIAYWLSENVLRTFESKESLCDLAEFKHGMSTSDNNRFLRLWFEVNIHRIRFNAHSKEDTFGDEIWFPYLKGGAYRKWWGNYEYVVNWHSDGKEIRDISNIKYPYLKGNLDFVLGGQKYFFTPGYTWSSISAGNISLRKFRAGFLFDAKGQCYFTKTEELGDIITAILNSNVAIVYLRALSPTMDFNSGVISRIPFMPKLLSHTEEIAHLVRENTLLSEKEWDSFETSWSFSKHPLLGTNCYLTDAYSRWTETLASIKEKMKHNEERINELIISSYELNAEVNPQVRDDLVSIRSADVQRDIRSLISYAIGCMLGRYSLDKPGLVFAGGSWDASQYVTYPADRDGILPITDDEYFEDDVVGMFINWVRTVYGAETLEENLAFIANALGGKGTPREVIRNYFLNDFYKDHLKVYQKRPIYWLFDSGKKNSFKCLIYMHRYQPDTIARIRTDYVHEMQSRYRTAMADVEQRINGATTSDRVKLTKRLTALQEQAEELRLYEEKIHHLADQMIAIDLDDGVKVNYAKFADVLAAIK